MENTCEICKKRLQRHEKKAPCNICFKSTHLRCLPNYSESDKEYALNSNGHWTCTCCLANIFPFYNVDDNDTLLHEINEQIEHIHDIDALNSLIFHPFELNDIDDFNDLDPDQNYYNPLMNQSLLNCKYYYTDQLNAETHTRTSEQISLLCMNIRSLRKIFTGFTTLLDIIDIKFQLIALTETWLKEYNTDLFNIDGYTHESQIREGREGGGVSFYIKNSINYKLREDLNHNTTDYHFFWLELDKRDMKSETNILVGSYIVDQGQMSVYLMKS